MIKINFFAGLTTTFPQPIDWKIKENMTISILFKELQSAYPEAADLLSRSRAAINEEIVDLSLSLEDQMEVFVLPPSCGG